MSSQRHGSCQRIRIGRRRGSRLVRENRFAFGGERGDMQRSFSRSSHRFVPASHTPDRRSIASRWQDHAATPEPGDVDGAIVEGSLARHPDRAQVFDGQACSPDIFEECDFAVVAAPAAGFEQFGEVVQPLLGQDASSAATTSRPRARSVRCAIK